MYKYLFVICSCIFLVAGCKFQADNNIADTGHHHRRETDSVLSKLAFLKDTDDIRNRFSLFNSHLTSLHDDSLALEVYDSIYRRTVNSSTSAIREIARLCCSFRGSIFWRWNNNNLARVEYEKYCTTSPQKTTLVDSTDFYIASSLGDIYLKLGDNEKSKAFYSWGFQENLKRPEKEQFGFCYSDMSGFYTVEEKYDSALWFAKKGLAVHTRNDDFKAIILINLPETYLALKQYQQAETSILDALEMFDSTHAYYHSIHFQMLGIYADALRNLSKPGEAIRQYRLAVKEGLSSQGSDKSREFSKLYRSFGDCFNQMGTRDSALYYYHKALSSVVKVNADINAFPAAQDLYQENAIQEALDSKAAWWLTSKEPMRLEYALKASELAMQVDDLLQQQFSFKSSKLAYQEQKKSRSNLAIDMCFRLYQQDHNQDRIKSAWIFSEAAKAALLRDEIKQQVAFEHNGKDTIIKQIKELEQAQNNLKTDMFLETDPTALQVLKDNYDKNTKNYILLASKLGPDQAGLASAKELHGNSDFIWNRLFADVPVIEFFAADNDKYYIFLKDKSGKLSLDTCYLPDSLINNRDSFFLDPARYNKNPARYKKLAFSIYEKLLGKTMSQNNFSSIIIIPDGNLWRLPWDALITKPDTGNSWQNAAFLLRTTSVTLGFSLLSLIQQDERPQQTAANSIVGFAPGFLKGERGLAPLTASVKEIEAIERTRPAGKYYLGKDATTSNYAKIATDAGILHISTHASYGVGEEECKLQFYDAAFFLHQLYQQPVKAKMVILCACETGRGKYEKGEGVYSMARSFYYAGAKNVITSLWKVDDERTSDLFRFFYQKKGEAYEMLREAKLQYLEEHAGAYASPYYWAAFSNTGYTHTTSYNKPALWIAVITVGLLTLILLFPFWKRKQAK